MVKKREAYFLSKTPLGEISIDYYGNLSRCNYFKCSKCIIFNSPRLYKGEKCQDILLNYLSTEYSIDDLSVDEIEFINDTQVGFLFRKNGDVWYYTPEMMNYLENAKPIAIEPGKFQFIPQDFYYPVYEIYLSIIENEKREMQNEKS